MTIAEAIAEAVRDFAEKGFHGETQLNDWLGRLRAAIAANLRSPPAMEEAMRDALGAIFKRLVDKGQILRAHPSVSRFTLARMSARLRPELDRRILASANLIKLNRVQMIEKTLQRFAGWATSVPKGGSDTVDRREVKAEIYKPIAQESWEVRRVLIDQGHKLNANISAVIAHDNGAIAVQWNSRWRVAGYNYRPDHKERDGLIYLLKDSWAKEQGLVKVGGNGYYDDVVDQVAVAPFCRCFATYLYSLRQLDKLEPDLLTVKGRAALEATRAA